MGDYAFDDPKKQPKLSDLTPEEHGPLVKIYYSYSSHGMKMGSGTVGNETVNWQKDGNVIIETNDHRDGKEKYEKYLAGPDAAEKLRSFVKENRMAEMAQIEKMRKLEEKKLSKDLEYAEIKGLRLEAIEKLDKIRPENIGQASRISGVSPADISVLLIWLAKNKNLTDR